MNPLLFGLNANEAGGRNPAVALIEMMRKIHACDQEEGFIHALAWADQHGLPDYPTLRLWAKGFGETPWNAALMERLREGHQRALASLTTEERRTVAPFLE